MIGFFKTLLFYFFLHIEINTINLKYTRRLPRPYQASKISAFLRKFLEHKLLPQLVGLNLAAAMMFMPFLGSSQEEVIYEPPILLQRSDLIIATSSTPEIHTQTREYVVPVENLRYVGQYYHPGHYAYDLNSHVGDAVLAFTSGRVHKTETGIFGLGRYIILDHGHGLTSVYAHLKNFTVSEGQAVGTGQKIGEVGMTGNTTGPHLHFEIHDNGHPQNPGEYLDL